MKQRFLLTKDYITLGQFLKEINVISSGGMAKYYVKEHAIYVDNDLENRRGRKLYENMMIEIPNVGTFFMAKMPEIKDQTNGN